MLKKFSFHDFFAGSGLVTEALKPYFAPVWSNDICPKKAAVYCANHDPGHFHLGSVADVNGRDLPRAALSWASFPCQDLSLAGKIEGIESRRSGLVWQWLRVMDEMAEAGGRPPVIVAENVVGLVSAKKGEHYRRLHVALVKRGYKVGAVLLDAAHWLPQSRPRVFVVGVQSQIAASSLQTSGPIWCHNKAIITAAKGAKDWVWWKLPEPRELRPSLDSIIEPGAECDPPERSAHNLALIPPRHRAMLEESVLLGFKVFPAYRRMRKGRQVLELRFDGMAGCLRTPEGGSSRQILVISENGSLATRLLTVRETARLMGAPDSYQLPARYNAGYKAMGDAVAIPAARYLAANLLHPLTKSRCHPPIFARILIKQRMTS
ncbi:MAG: DNA cytosine methyltransferase [Candidatus Sumerlaeota bacterium]|nr:DNA cytosine methyltransferase [Candidatus Sumerlaeota bacterium]